MSMYLCKLVNKGYIQDCFYREGQSAKDVREDLECFSWPVGQWKIAPADADDLDE